MFHSMASLFRRHALPCSLAAAAFLVVQQPLMGQLSSPDPVRTALTSQLAQDLNDGLGLAESDLFSLIVRGAPGEPITAMIPLEGNDFTLDLAPHSTRSASNYKLLVQGADGQLTETTPNPVRTLRGTVKEIPGSKVAASFDENGGLYARIQVPGEASDYWVEQVSMTLAGTTADVHVSYRGSDVVGDGSTCGVNALPASSPGQIALGSGCGTGLCVAELGCDSDVEYYQDYGSSVSNVENRINAIINAMNMQYEDDAGLRHDITSIVVRTSEPDPYSSNDISNLLTQLRSQWLGPLSGTPHDVAQLFTGRSISGSTIGLAWLGSVCNSQRYSVVENFTNSFGCLTDLSAHELGHNWGAGHCSCSNFTMNPSITCSNQFSNGSIAAITGTKISVGCLSPAGPPEVSFNASFTSGPAPLAVLFTNTSGGEVTSWLWNFGDGNTSTQSDLTQIYNTPGTYTVSLTGTGPMGVDTETKLNLVTVGEPLVVFDDLGGGTASPFFGVPDLSASGPLTAGSTLDVLLKQAPPNTLSLAWIAFNSVPAPAFGGTLFANPPAQQLFFPTSLFGTVMLSTGWPAGVPVGLDIYLQFLVQDFAVVGGVSLSNAVHGVTP